MTKLTISQPEELVRAKWANLRAYSNKIQIDTEYEPQGQVPLVLFEIGGVKYSVLLIDRPYLKTKFLRVVREQRPKNKFNSGTITDYIGDVALW